LTYCSGTPAPTYVSLRGFYDNKKKLKPYVIEAARVDAGVSQAAARVAQRCADAAEPVVFCPPVATFKTARGATEANLAEGLALTVELDEDPDTARAKLEGLLGLGTLVLASGGEWARPDGSTVLPKLHLHWRLKVPTRDPEAHAKLKGARKLATKLAGGDASNDPVVHPIRWAGSWHRKTTPRPCKIIAEHPDAEIDLADAVRILEAATGETVATTIRPKSTKPAPTVTSASAREKGRKYLAEDAEPAVAYGGCDLLTLKIAFKLRRFGYAEYDCIKDMVEIWNPRGQPPVGEELIRQKVYNAYEYGKDEPGCEPPAAEVFEAIDGPLDIFGDASITGEPTLERDALPKVIADFAWDAAERMGVEPAMIAIPALAACASALHDGFKIQPKARDTSWIEHPVLWVGLIGEPGTKKTPALKAVLQPLEELQSEWAKEYRTALAQFEAVDEAPKAPPKKPATDDEPLTHESLGMDAPAITAPPVERRILVKDATTEALAPILADNNRGILGAFDELAGLIGSFDAYRSAKGKDRSIYLELWNGGPRHIDRVKGSIFVPNWSACVLGGIQPEKVRKLAGQLSDDGFLQRFIVFAGRNTGEGVDREPDAAATGGYRSLVRQLVRFNPTDFNNPVRLSPAAQEHRNQVSAVVAAMMVLPDTAGAMKGHLDKWGGYFARLLLVYHAIECTAAGHGIADTVPGATAAKVARLMLQFLLPQATRFYADVLGPDECTGHARWVAGYVLAEKRAEVSTRDIYRALRAVRNDHAAIPRAMGVLEMAGWAAPVDPGRGKPVTKWQINPKVHAAFAARAEQERARRGNIKVDIHKAAAMVRERTAS
jgi:hypothetical protein